MRWNARTEFAGSLLVAALSAIGVLACGRGERCPWGVDELLAEVAVEVDAPLDCGRFGFLDDRTAAWECFDSAVTDGRPAMLTVNLGVDSDYWSTFVATEGGELFRVEMVDDWFGGAPRSVAVERCESIAERTIDDGFPYPEQCVGAVELYACADSKR
jgi:hypothetical protein